MNDIARWLRNGADVREGLRLLSLYAPNPPFARLVEKQPALFGRYLVRALQPFAGQDSPAAPGGYRFRDEWPFLSLPDCPMELKILATDKITAYHNTVMLHGELFSCPDDKCYETAKNLLENFRQNRQITAEFAYYKEHGSVLGKHPIFGRSSAFDTYRKMSVRELLREQARLKESIWRNLDEIKKGTKPHLDESRYARVAEKRQRLAFVEKLIDESERPGTPPDKKKHKTHAA